MHNQKPTTSINRKRDRLAYLWLALGILFFAFGTLRWTIPLAAWLYPVFLLRFVRTQPLLRGILLVLLALVFPLAMTTIWYVIGLLSPYGTMANPTYTQYGNLPLLQLVSVTGLWGIVFLMSWFASLVNWAWERGFAWPRVRGGAVLYGSLLALVLLFGSARLALFPAQGSTVRVAGISPSPALLDAVDKQVSQKNKNTLSREIIRQAGAPVYDELLARSEQEARAGAKIIVWPECSGDVALLQENEAGLLARASSLARTTGTYLDLGLCVRLSHPVPSRFVFDEIILIDPTGSVVWRYQKAHPVPGEPFPPGDGLVPTVQTPYGRLSNVICFDADFPGTLRQAGQAGAAIMLVPSNDWREVDPYHTQLITFRAIENGYSLVRQTSRGLAMTVAYVPMQGVRTIYATIGDLFAWLSIAGLILLIGVAISRRRTAGEPPEASPT